MEEVREEKVSWLERVRTYGHLIKFSHTVFALPFALGAVALAHREHPVSIPTLVWIVLAMAGARSAAMGFNRLVDFEYDRRNPRTSGRPLTAGLIDRRSVFILILVSSLVFIVCAAALGSLCFKLSLPVLGVLFSYSYTKRFTSLSHLVLGFGIGLAPLGAWIASTGTMDGRVVLLSLALMTYIAGFDILYACQDVAFDQRERLHSIPSRWGPQKAFRISSQLHGATFALLTAVYFAFDLGRFYLMALAVIAVLLHLEHRVVKPNDLDNIDLAFFHINSAISILLFAGIFTDVLLA